MAKHDLNAHVEILKSAYRRKRNLMLQTIRQTFPQKVSCTEPQGGLFTWLTFPRGFDTTLFMRNCALPKAKVAYVPGASFFPEKIEQNHARFNFSGQPDEIIVKGITALATYVKQEIAKS